MDIAVYLLQYHMCFRSSRGFMVGHLRNNQECGTMLGISDFTSGPVKSISEIIGIISDQIHRRWCNPIAKNRQVNHRHPMRLG